MIKRFIILTLALVILPVVMKSQPATDDPFSSCFPAAGDSITYLKDFRIQLPKAVSATAIPVYKASIYLMKDMKYRFSVCDKPGSKGELIVTIFDQGKELISSFNKDTGKKYCSIDFFCNKTGLYTLWYEFRNGEQGSGTGVVSMIK